MPVPTLVFKEGGWCEALKTSYVPGVYQPRTEEEYRALAPFAVNARALEPAPVVSTVIDGTLNVSGYQPSTDFVDNCQDIQALSVYAQERGIKFHHKAGIEKIRAAIKSSR